MMWLMRSSPLDVRKLFWVKYWVGTLPLLVVALPLIVATNLILEASPFIRQARVGDELVVKGDNGDEIGGVLIVAPWEGAHVTLAI